MTSNKINLNGIIINEIYYSNDIVHFDISLAYNNYLVSFDVSIEEFYQDGLGYKDTWYFVDEDIYGVIQCKQPEGLDKFWKNRLNEAFEDYLEGEYK